MFFKRLMEGKRKKLVKNVDTIVDATLFRTDDILDARREVIQQFDDLVTALDTYNTELNNLELSIRKSRETIVALCGKEA